MVDIKSFNQVLKSTWVKKYLDPANQEKQKLILNSELQNLGGPAVFKGNLNRNDLHDQLISPSDPFMKKILEIWSEITYEPDVKSNNHYCSMSL